MIEDRSTANADPTGKTTYVFQDRAGKPGGGKGPLVSNGYYPTMTGHPFMMCTEESVISFEGNGCRPSHKGVGFSDEGVMYTLNTTEVHGVMYPESVWVDRHVNIGTDDLAPTLCAKYGTGGNNMPCVMDEPIAYPQNATDSRVLPINDDVCPTLNTRIGSGGPNAPLIREPIGAGNFPVMCNAQHCYNIENDKTPCLIARAGTGGNNIPMFLEDTNMNEMKYVVRRITPRECERLQGFPDEYTNIPWPKGQCPDSHRYKALGNSMAVPVMRLIGESIDFALSHPITEDKSDKIAYQTSLFDF